MKWYSVKKYKPIIIYDYLVINKDGGIRVAWNKEYTNGDIGWFCSEEETPIEGVTHFCIPDPIPIED